MFDVTYPQQNSLKAQAIRSLSPFTPLITLDSMHYLEDCTVTYAWVSWNEAGEAVVSEPEILERRAFRAARVIDESERILFLYFPMVSQPRLRKAFLGQIVKSDLTVGGKT